MRKLLLGAIAATSYIATKVAGRRKDKTSHADDVQESSGISDNLKVKIALPQFSVGDLVVTLNPYTSDYAIIDIDEETPLYYEIEGTAWDEESGCYRYKIDSEEGWFAESWLIDTPYPIMAKELGEENTNEMGAVNVIGGSDFTLWTQKERNELSDAMDEMSRGRYVDYLLDTMIHGNTEEKTEAERRLSELVNSEGAE